MSMSKLFSYNQWIGLREKSEESPKFNGKIYGLVSCRCFFPVDFPLNQSIDTNVGN